MEIRDSRYPITKEHLAASQADIERLEKKIDKQLMVQAEAERARLNTETSSLLGYQKVDALEKENKELRSQLEKRIKKLEKN